MKADLIIRNGTIYDGSGTPARVGDVAIQGERILAAGECFAGEAPEELDATGLCVAPGFIDLHNHGDQEIGKSSEHSAAQNYLRQGCTTIVTGNCGTGTIKVGDYFDGLTQMGIGLNVCHLVPHGKIRNEVLGMEDRAPSASELEEMKKMVRQGMENGAMGFSTGLIYVPGSFADTQELIELAKVAHGFGGIYASHMRGEGQTLLQAIAEALEIGRKSGCPVHISHFKASGPNAWGKAPEACKAVEEAQAQGQRVTADQYPYCASSTDLKTTTVPMKARATLETRLANKEDYAKLREQVREIVEREGQASRVMIAGGDKVREWAGKTLEKIAQEMGNSPADVCLHILAKANPSIIHFSMNEEDVCYFMQKPYVATASDGGVCAPGATGICHPRSYGTFPRKIREYAINKRCITMEHAIRSASGLPADIFGLKDRGYLRPGFIADIAVFDSGKIQDQATFENPRQFATGFQRVFVAGKAAIQNDSFTGVYAGRVLRRNQV